MPKVYISQEPTRWDHDLNVWVPMMDFEPAKQYGELVVCLPPTVSFQVLTPTLVQLKERMREFAHDDYLIAVGSPLAMVLASSLAMRLTRGKLNLLSWDKRERCYINTRIRL